MSRGKHRLPLAAAVVLLAAVVAFLVWTRQRPVKVQVSRARREDLISIVRATGQIIPTTYANVLGQGFGRVTGIFVHEGEFVRPGDLLLQVDPVQPASAVRAQQALVDSARATLRAAQASLEGAQAQVAEDEAALQKARYDWQQEQKLYQAGVISRQSAETYRTAFADAQASLGAARARVTVMLGQQAAAGDQLNQAQAVLAQEQDVLNKTTYLAPFAGTVTNIAVHVGEDVIPGVPDSPGAYLMTISDMSAPAAEVRVGENDVTFLNVGQPASVQIDAYPGGTFAGRVQQVGAQAMLSESGMATSQTTGGGSAQEATDYLVDIALNDAPKGLLPGMTVTSVIQTTHKKDAVAVPFQALVLRPKDEAGRTAPPSIRTAASVEIAASPAPQEKQLAGGLQGVFAVRAGRAIFTPVRIGMLGENDVEVLTGVQPGEEIVVGDYAALRILHSGMPVKVVTNRK